MQTSMLRIDIIRKYLFNRFIKMSTPLNVHFLAITHAMLFFCTISVRSFFIIERIFQYRLRRWRPQLLCAVINCNRPEGTILSLWLTYCFCFYFYTLLFSREPNHQRLSECVYNYVSADQNQQKNYVKSEELKR